MLTFAFDRANRVVPSNDRKEMSQMSVRIDRVAMIAEMARQDINCNRLVELSGVSRVTVTAVRNGKSCSKETADKLAAVLGRDIIREEA